MWECVRACVMYATELCESLCVRTFTRAYMYSKPWNIVERPCIIILYWRFCSVLLTVRFEFECSNSVRLFCRNVCIFLNLSLSAVCDHIFFTSLDKTLARIESNETLISSVCVFLFSNLRFSLALFIPFFAVYRDLKVKCLHTCRNQGHFNMKNVKLCYLRTHMSSFFRSTINFFVSLFEWFCALFFLSSHRIASL